MAGVFPLPHMRRFTASIASAAMLLPSLAGAIAAPFSVNIDGQVTTFTDVPSDAWYTEYLEVAVTAGIVGGYVDPRGNPRNLFGPADNVTYAQAMKIAVEAAGYPVDEYPASGMYPGHWAATYMEVAAQNAFLSAEGDAQPIDRPATRAEVALIMADAFQVEPGTMEDEHYTDVSDDTAFAAHIAALTRDGVVSGDVRADGELANTYRPGAPINRAETVKMAMAAWAEYGDRGVESFPREQSATTSSSSSRSSQGAVQQSSSSSSRDDGMNHTSSSSQSGTAGGSSSAGVTVVTYTEAGFSPSTITIKAGDTITFKNESNAVMWVKSDTQGGFDAGSGVAKGGLFTFKFTQAGTWTFANNSHMQHTGTIVVE
jgi:plastocyanin